MSEVFIVQGAIWRDDAYILIVRSPQEEHYADLLAWVGGRVEGTDESYQVLEHTLQREVMEEIGIEITDITYAYSQRFKNPDEEPVISVEFLCRYADGEPKIIDPSEVGEILHLTPQEILAHPKCPEWTKISLNIMEALREKLGW